MSLVELPPIDVDEEYKLLIGGEWVATSDAYDIVDPNTTAVIGRAPEASVAQVEDAAAAARAALPGWRNTPMADRCELLGRTAEVMAKRLPTCCRSCRPRPARRSTSPRRCSCRCASSGSATTRSRRASTRPSTPYPVQATALGPAGLMTAHVVHQPVGVVACITPYNFPLTNVAGKIAPALAMGNTVVIKPAPQDPLAMVKFGEVIEEVGFPPCGQHRDGKGSRDRFRAGRLEGRRHDQLHRKLPGGRPHHGGGGQDHEAAC